MIGALTNAEEMAQSNMLRAAVESAIGDLADTAVRLAPLEGIKHVVLMSAGFDPSLVHGVPSMRNPNGMRSSRDPEVRAGLGFDPGLISAVRRMHDTFKASGVFLDAIDIGGLRFMQRGSDNEALYMLAGETGGEVVDNRNDLGSALQFLVRSQRLAYVLAFNAPKTNRAQNTIAVSSSTCLTSRAWYRESYASRPIRPTPAIPYVSPTS
jgi:hypothetical protein